MEKKENHTEIWSKYEKCKKYVDQKAIVRRSEQHWNFFLGYQWKGIESGGEKLPMLNFIKPIVQYKVSTIAQNAMVAMYSDMSGNTGYAEVYEKLNQFWGQCWEKAKMDSVIWRVLKAGAIQGDTYAYWENADTTQTPQIIDNTSVFLSDENIIEIQDQEYIIIRERWSLSAIKRHAQENGIDEDLIKQIAADNQTNEQLINRTEVEDKVTVLFYMEKKDGIIHTGRATQSVIIEPVEEIKGSVERGEIKGLTVYPIIPFVWEHVPNSARGISEVEQLIPNQLELNKTLARRGIATQLGAYPRLAYDANAIENPEDLNKVGVAIAVNGGNAQSIQQMISYLNATNISSDAEKLSADLLQITKDLAGATDYAMGNINPEYASGQAIIAVRDQSQVPLNEQVARLKQWVEDVSILWIDLWIAYNPNGLSFETEDENGNMQEVTVSQQDLTNLKPSVKIDVSPDNRWTKLAEQQTIDNLLANGQVTLAEYAEITPDNSSVPKGRLKQILDKREAQGMEQGMEQALASMGQQEEDPMLEEL